MLSLDTETELYHLAVNFSIKFSYMFSCFNNSSIFLEIRAMLSNDYCVQHCGSRGRYPVVPNNAADFICRLKGTFWTLLILLTQRSNQSFFSGVGF